MRQEFFVWSVSQRSPKEFSGQGDGLSQKLASRKGLAAERMPTKISVLSVPSVAKKSV
jgi:hypothetical protein